MIAYAATELHPVFVLLWQACRLFAPILKSQNENMLLIAEGGSAFFLCIYGQLTKNTLIKLMHLLLINSTNAHLDESNRLLAIELYIEISE